MPPGPFPDNATMAFDTESKRFAFAGHEHATLWDLQTGRLLQTWKLPPSLNNQLSFHGSDRLVLFRQETAIASARLQTIIPRIILGSTASTTSSDQHPSPP